MPAPARLRLILLATAGVAAAAAAPYDLQSLAERAAIQDLFTRYTGSVDRQDWSAYRSVFTSDAAIDYTAAGGKAGDVETIATWMEEVFGWFEGSQHAVSNFEIRLYEGRASGGVDGASVRALFDNPFNLRYLPFPRPFVRCGGWYVAELRKVAGDWKIAKLHEEMAYNTVIPSVIGLLAGVAAVLYVLVSQVRAVMMARGDHNQSQGGGGGGSPKRKKQ